MKNFLILITGRRTIKEIAKEIDYNTTADTSYDAMRNALDYAEEQKLIIQSICIITVSTPPAYKTF